MLRYFLLNLFVFLTCFSLSAKENPAARSKKTKEEVASLREPCSPGVSFATQNVNNVRAMLLVNGDVWWDGDNPQYIVPKPPEGSNEIGVSALYAGAVWVGGFDAGGNLKMAAKTYGAARGETDFWPGPISLDTTVDKSVICNQWDKHFEVTGEDIDLHLRNYNAAVAAGVAYSQDDVPVSILGWPAKGNDFFSEIHNFELPNTSAGLAGFFDRDGDEIYNPLQGDYPVIEVRGCDEPQYPDQMFFWIYNDDGNVHSQTTGTVPLKMEIQVQAFAYKSNDALNDMTFQRYKLVNRGTDVLDSTFFAMWVDPDLGCANDDYIGCDVESSFAYIYNSDPVDGIAEGSCDCESTPTYCDEIPMLGIDYFRGPLDENGDELGMSSFTYYNNGGSDPPPADATTDPDLGSQYYNYISGSWKDGTPFTEGGAGYGGATPTKYVFPGDPSVPGEWTMAEEALETGDRRTLQASGPLRLLPGATNELIIGAVFVGDIPNHPRVSLTKLLAADKIAQAAFDNCFKIPQGPDAPDVDWLELDQEVVGLLSNDSLTSNNYKERYSEQDLQAGDDSVKYEFEGYEVYQIRTYNESPDLTDADNARLVFKSDIKNGVTKVYEWVAEDNAVGYEPSNVYSVITRADGSDEGLRKSFSVKNDAFTSQPLINHTKYYYFAIAYGYNNFAPFDTENPELGQPRQYIKGRKNTKVYTVTPRPITTEVLNSTYGDGPIVTRLDGMGTGKKFIEVADESETAILNGTNDGQVVYKRGAAPIDVIVYNPFNITEGQYRLTIEDTDNDNALDYWFITDPNGVVTKSDTSILDPREQLLTNYGFSVDISQLAGVGTNGDSKNGATGMQLEYANTSGASWFAAVEEANDGAFDYTKTEQGDFENGLDPTNSLSREFGDGAFVPFRLTNRTPGGNTNFVVGPTWFGNGSAVLALRGLLPSLEELNNVDIVFTSDKDKWSRCVILESANPYYATLGFETEGLSGNMDLRAAPSVGKTLGSDGKPAPDGAVDADGQPVRGMGWFPGYAIDVETGKRLNIFFSENSVYDCSVEGISQLCEQGAFLNGNPTGRDMMFNPTSDEFINNGQGEFNALSAYAGGQHFVFVTDEEYDGCARIYEAVKASGDFSQIQKGAYNDITWTGIPILARNTQLLSYDEGLIPNDLTVKLRVKHAYGREKLGEDTFGGDPTYLLDFAGTKATAATTKPQIDSVLSMINVVPNPYYGFSDYQTGKYTETIKITNLPAKAIVTIYTLDGKFVRQFNRDETATMNSGTYRALAESQIIPDLEWNLTNSKNVPVGSGVYLIHVNAPGYGETIIKWFGVGREFDPSGLE